MRLNQGPSEPGPMPHGCASVGAFWCSAIPSSTELPLLLPAQADEAAETWKGACVGPGVLFNLEQIA